MSHGAPRSAVGRATGVPAAPDTVAYVRCQRCGRPTCPSASDPRRSASVRRLRRAGCQAGERGRTVFGGQVAVGRPLVTLSIIGLCAAVFPPGRRSSPGLTNDIAFVPRWEVRAVALPHGRLCTADDDPASPSTSYALWIMGTTSSRSGSGPLPRGLPRDGPGWLGPVTLLLAPPAHPPPADPTSANRAPGSHHRPEPQVRCSASSAPSSCSIGGWVGPQPAWSR